MRFNPAEFLARYDAQDGALVAGGFPPTSPWWREQIERFVTLLGSCLDERRRRSLLRRWVIRAGRRSGKSTTLSRLLMAWALYGAWSVPPGDVAIVAIVSVDRGEAAARLRTIRDILTALGIEHEARADEVEITDPRVRRSVLRVYTCSVNSVGMTTIAIFGDEVALWSNRETGQNPASRVIPQLAPSLATQPFGFMILSSSAWTTDSFHEQCFQEGDTTSQITSAATTWVGNPSLSEQDTHALEPNHADWLRSYGNEPSDAIVENFFAEGVDMSIDKDPPRPRDRSRRYAIAIDPSFSASTKDRFGVAVVSSVYAGRDPVTQVLTGRTTIVHEAHGWIADRSPLGMAVRLRDDVLRPLNHTEKVFTDQAEGFSFSELARQADVKLTVIPWKGGEAEFSKAQRFRAVRVAMLSGEFRIPNDPSLIRELRSVRRILTPAGNERIEVPRTSDGHGDRTSAIVLAASLALEAKPEFPASVWTVADYEHEFAKYRERARYFPHHEVFNPTGEEFGRGYRISFQQLRQMVAAGVFKESGCPYGKGDYESHTKVPFKYGMAQ